MLHVMVKNIGGEDGDVVVENPLTLYDVFVTLTNKMVIPPTLKKQIIRNFRMNIGGGHVESLKPGEITTPLDYPLSQIFDLSSPNTYRVKVVREFTIDFDATAKKFKSVKVISNEVEITVENKLPPNN